MFKRGIAAVVVIVCLLLGGIASSAVIMERSTLFIEVLKVNPENTDYIVSLMSFYLEKPESASVGELKKVVTKAIGDEKRAYLIEAGYAVKDFVDTFDVVAAMTADQRAKLYEDIKAKSFDSVYGALAQYDSVLLISGDQKVPEGPVAVGKTTMDWQDRDANKTDPKHNAIQQLRDMQEKDHSQTLVKAENLLKQKHWSDGIVKWYMDQGEPTTPEVFLMNRDQPITVKAFVSLLYEYYATERGVKIETSLANEATLTRMDAFRMVGSLIKESPTMDKKTSKELKQLKAADREVIWKLMSHKIISGKTPSSIDPDNYITVAEALALIKNLAKYNN